MPDKKMRKFTGIPNDALEALARIRIPGEARQLLDVIIRQTIGYQKDQDRISTAQFIEKTGLNHRTVYKARRRLREMNLITIYQKGDSQNLSYSFQEDYKKWTPSPKKELSTKKEIAVSQKVDRYLPKRSQTVSQLATHKRNKDNISKEIIQKKYIYNDHVLLTKDEHKNLIDIYGSSVTKEYVDRLNDYAEQFPQRFAKYNSHSATIRNWMRRDKVNRLLPRKQNCPKEEVRYDPRVADLVHKTAAEMKKHENQKALATI